MKNEVDGRREIASRNTAWANNIARKLTRWGVTPNQISMMSVFFAMIGCLLLFSSDIFFSVTSFSKRKCRLPATSL